MKFNPLYGLVGGCLVGALALLPLMAKADMLQANQTAVTAVPTQLAEATPQGMSQALPPLLAALEDLDLTADQEAQLSTIRRETRTQLEAVVQPEQRQQFKTMLQQGGSFRQAVNAMNLTPDQKQQVRSIFQSARQQGAMVLTTAQRQELRQLIQQRLDRAL